MVTLGDTAYTFTSPTSRAGMAVSTNNELAILKTGNSIAGFTTLITGTNVDGNTMATDITNIDIIAHGTITQQQPTSGEVIYTGDYLIGRVPSAMDSIENSIATGTVSLTANFDTISFTGTATDENDNTSGMFTGGLIATFASGVQVRNLTFDGSGTLDYVDAVDLFVNFIGNNATHISGTGKSNSAEPQGNHIVMGVVATANNN